MVNKLLSNLQHFTPMIMCGLLRKNYTGGVRSVLLKGMYVWGLGCQPFREEDKQFKTHEKAVLLLFLWFLEILFLELDAFESRQKLWHTFHFDHTLH